MSILLAINCGLFGVIFATILCKYLIAASPFVYSIGKFSLNENGIEVLKDYWKHFIIMLICMIISWQICAPIHMNGSILGLIEEGFIVIIIVVTTYIVINFKNDDFIFIYRRAIVLLKSLRKREKNGG